LRRGGRPATRLAARRRHRTTATATATATALPTAKHHQLPPADLGHVLGDPVLVFIGAVLDLALDVDGVALLEIPLGDVRELLPQNDSVPLGLLLLGTGTIGPAPARGNGDVGDA